MHSFKWSSRTSWPSWTDLPLEIRVPDGPEVWMVNGIRVINFTIWMWHKRLQSYMIIFFFKQMIVKRRTWRWRRRRRYVLKMTMRLTMEGTPSLLLPQPPLPLFLAPPYTKTSLPWFILKAPLGSRAIKSCSENSVYAEDLQTVDFWIWIFVFENQF